MKDFENWYDWHLKHVGFVDRHTALKAYNMYYSCNCESCKYRKEKGLPPVKLSNACKAPINQEGLEKLCQSLSQ